MELDELKTKWHELDGRLSCADTKIDRLTAEVSAGKITSAKQRLARTIRLGIFLLAVLPLCFANIFRTGEADPGTAVKATLVLFIFAMLARQIALLVLLAQPMGTISPWFPIILIGLGGAAHQSWSANIFSTIGDMFPKSAIATVTGIGGMAGGVGSMILQWFAGWLFVYADETAMQFMGFEGKPAGYFVVFCICAVA